MVLNERIIVWYGSVGYVSVWYGGIGSEVWCGTEEGEEAGLYKWSPDTALIPRYYWMYHTGPNQGFM